MNRECGAKAKTNDHQPCRRLAMTNGRCHLHGGMSTGAKTARGKLRQRIASWKHGMYSKEFKREINLMRNMVQKFQNEINN